VKAFITVSDASGRVLFRRRATEAEITEAVHAAEEADAGAEAVMHEIAAERYAALAAGTTISQELEAPAELAEVEQLAAVSSQPEYTAQPMGEMESSEAGTDDGGLDPWFGDARFSQEEELAS
jgi:hypothetical protein